LFLSTLKGDLKKLQKKIIKRKKEEGKYKIK
jgi:hypothetical protein